MKQKIFIVFALFLLILLSMGLFSFFKKGQSKREVALSFDSPYKDSAINLMYNLLFCDDVSLLQSKMTEPYEHPFNVLFSEHGNVSELQHIANDTKSDPRMRALAANRLIKLGYKAPDKEIFAVIVEVGLDNGLDVLASFCNGTARYINYSGNMIVWEATDARSDSLTKNIFSASRNIVDKIGPWDNIGDCTLKKAMPASHFWFQMDFISEKLQLIHYLLTNLQVLH